MHLYTLVNLLPTFMHAFCVHSVYIMFASLPLLEAVCFRTIIFYIYFLSFVFLPPVGMTAIYPSSVAFVGFFLAAVLEVVAANNPNGWDG